MSISITDVNPSTTRVTFTVEGYHSSTLWCYYYIVERYSNGSVIEEESRSWFTGTDTDEVTVTGLSSDTRYKITVYLYNDSWDFDNLDEWIYRDSTTFWTDEETSSGGGSGDAYEWYEMSEEKNIYSDSFELEYYLYDYEVGYVRFTPDTNGTVTIYTEGDYDNYGYLSLYGEVEIDSEGAVVGSVLEENDDSGSSSNFKIIYDVEADVDYEIDIHSLGHDEDIEGVLYVEFEPEQSGWYFSTSRKAITQANGYYNATKYSYSYNLSQQEVKRCRYIATSPGLLIIQGASGNSYDTVGFLSVGSEGTINSTASNGINAVTSNSNTTTFLSNDDGASNNQYYLSYQNDATSSTPIYFQFAAYSKTKSGAITNQIEYRLRYNVIYNTNGGSSIANTYYYYNTASSIASQIPQKTGYAFLGWDTSSNASTVVYAPGANLSANTSASDITLYAVWAKLQTFYWTNTNYSSNGSTQYLHDLTTPKGIAINWYAPASQVKDFINKINTYCGTSLTFNEKQLLTDYNALVNALNNSSAPNHLSGTTAPSLSTKSTDDFISSDDLIALENAFNNRKFI